MTSIAPSQLTLNFEPTITDRFASLREYIAHRVQVNEKPAKTIAMDMDLSPSALSRKLSAGLAEGDKDTQRFNVDDLELFMQKTKDFSAIEYLAAKYLQNDEQRKSSAIVRVEALTTELARALASLKAAA